MVATAYSITVLDGEQHNARRLLSALHGYLRQETRNDMELEDFDWLQQAFDILVKADKYCRERKVELFVIPALRKASDEGDALLDRLDAHSLDRMRILGYLYNQLRRAASGAPVDFGTVAATMRLYCDQMLKRLLLEEQELLPLARRLLTEEEWFRVASQCLSHAKAGRRGRSFACYTGMSQRGRAPVRYLH